MFLPPVAVVVMFACLSSYYSIWPTSSSQDNIYNDKKFLPTGSSCPLETYCANTSYPVMGGLDFVQYFTDFKISDGVYNESKIGEMGSSNYTSELNGYTFYFLSSTNKDLFDSSPSSYIPQWGGFCAWGMATETYPKYPWGESCLGPSGDWGQWVIVDEKLYFFKDSDPKSNFMSGDYDEYVTLGNERWYSWFSSYDNYFDTLCYTS